MLVNPEQCFPLSLLNSLLQSPTKAVTAGIVSARVAIPYIGDETQRYFGNMAASMAGDISFQHFGLVAEFKDEAMLELFDSNYNLNPLLKDLVRQFGVCLLKNVRLHNPAGAGYQKNIFPNLVFHIDRGPQFENQYSLFYRDPADLEHAQPRTTSTLIIPNAAARLQGIKEGVWEKCSAVNCQLFGDGSLRSAIGKIVVEQPWSAPEKTGEICLFDNRTVLHASHHRNGYGYQIAVQYLY